ncbi:hypothetical protein V6N11_031489 [Hibiscus sabdariffa]|uniref:Uncharacterized protein n=1 Tax=Hibiscus sabdariffa TaxID=183260 RepID=A0ABR2SYF8_9ROSI
MSQSLPLHSLQYILYVPFQYDMHLKGNIGNKEVKGRTSNPETKKKEKDDEKITQDKDQRICDVFELEVGNFVYDVRIMEVGFLDNSSKNVEIGKEITAQKEKSSSSTKESSSSESQSPMNGDSQRSWGVEVTLNAGNLGIKSNHGKEDITLEKVRLQEDRGGVGVSYETSTAVTENSKENNKGQKVVNRSKIEINWVEFLFKNKEAQKEISDGWASEVGLVNSGSKGPSAIEDGGVDKKEMDSDLNHNRTPKIANGLSEILRDQKEIDERNVGKNKHPRSPIWKSVDEGHRVEQGEYEFYSSSDREENWNKAERVFFPELVLKKNYKKAVWIVETDSR